MKRKPKPKQIRLPIWTFPNRLTKQERQLIAQLNILHLDKTGFVRDFYVKYPTYQSITQCLEIIKHEGHIPILIHVYHEQKNRISIFYTAREHIQNTIPNKWHTLQSSKIQFQLQKSNKD